MSRVGFEPMISVFKQAKMVHVLDRATTVIGWIVLNGVNYRMICSDAYHVRVIKLQAIYDLSVSNKNTAESPWTTRHIDRQEWCQSDVSKEGTGKEHAL
jgi:hypothetical protein